MSTLKIALSRSELGYDAASNFAYMEREARSFKPFGDIDFDAPCWVVGAARMTSSRKQRSLWFTRQKDDGDACKSASTRDRLPSRCATFIKSVIVLAQKQTPTMSHAKREALVRVFRYLQMALDERGEVDPCGATSADFLRADAMARARSKFPNTRYGIGIGLTQLATLMRHYRLTRSVVAFETDTTPPDVENRPREVLERLRPSDAALAALPEIASKVSEQADIVRMSVVKIVHCGPMRIGDVLEMPEDCEIVRTGGAPGTLADLDNVDGRKVAYGLRFYEAKYSRWQERFFATEVVPMVRKAIADIRMFSVHSRMVASQYASGGCVWLPPGLDGDAILAVEDVRNAFRMGRKQMNDWLKQRSIEVIPLHVARLDLEEGLGRESQPKRASRRVQLAAVRALLEVDPARKRFAVEEIGQVIESSNPWKWLRQHGVGTRPRSLRRCDLEAAIVRHVPHAELPQPLQDCLFVFPRNFFRDTQSLLSEVSMLTVDQMRVFLGSSDQVESIFERFGYFERDGNPMRISTHMFRRWLITKAIGSELGAEMTREFAGHDDVTTQTNYNLVSAEDRALRAKRVGADWKPSHLSA